MRMPWVLFTLHALDRPLRKRRRQRRARKTSLGRRRPVPRPLRPQGPFLPIRSANGACSYQPGATPQGCVPPFHQGPTARLIGGETDSTFFVAARGWDGLSALGSYYRPFLRRCPRLVWRRTFGARERRATSHKSSPAAWRRFQRHERHMEQKQRLGTVRRVIDWMIPSRDLLIRSDFGGDRGGGTR